MGKVIVAATVSLDGLIADEHDDVGPLFDWYGNGDVAVTLADPDRLFHVSEASADYVRSLDGVRAAVIAIGQARDFAGDGDVSVTAGEIGSQALEAGLVDELHLGVVPVLFGGGKRFFREATEQMLENPQIIEGDRVLHLAYSVRRG